MMRNVEFLNVLPHELVSAHVEFCFESIGLTVVTCVNYTAVCSCRKEATSSHFSISRTLILRLASLSSIAVPTIPPPITIQSYFIGYIPLKLDLLLFLHSSD